MKRLQWLGLLFVIVAAPIDARAAAVLNEGFEIDESIADGLPVTLWDWSGDLATIVTAENGITPIEGTGMLRFDATFQTGPGGISSDVWQLIDVSSWGTQIAEGTATISWSAAFNRVAGDSESEPQFAVSIRAFSGLPAAFPTIANSPLASGGTFLMSDSDPRTWETISTAVLLPSDTAYVALLVAARETLSNSGSNEFDGHYADQGQLNISAPEPATLLLVGGGLAAARMRKNRRKSGAH
jgi:hypothetical protein